MPAIQAADNDNEKGKESAPSQQQCTFFHLNNPESGMERSSNDSFPVPFKTTEVFVFALIILFIDIHTLLALFMQNLFRKSLS